MTDYVKVHADPNMDSAGAELMGLSYRLAEHPEFAEDAERLRVIGCWLSVSRATDMEMSLIKVVGALVGTMRHRNIPFDDDLPMAPQFEAFLKALPDPLPGQQGYVDQNTLPPIDRRDTFEAEVAIADVRVWTAHDDVPRAVARECRVTPPGGVAGDAMIFAEGADEIALLADGTTATLLLRSLGGTLRVMVPAAKG